MIREVDLIAGGSRRMLHAEYLQRNFLGVQPQPELFAQDGEYGMSIVP